MRASVLKFVALGMAVAPLALSAASATSLDLSGASLLGADGFSASTVRVGLSDVPLGGATAAFGVSDRAADLTLSRGLPLSALGTVNARLSGAVAFSGGLRLSSGVSGTLGPVALSVTANVWTVPQAVFDPLAPFASDPTSVRPSGWNVEAAGRYRVDRDTQVLASGSLGEQPNVAVGGEWRRGTLSLRGGGRVGADVLGVTGGLTVRGENSTVALDALVGPSSLGVTGNLSLPAPLEDRASSLRLYFAYEPWRTNTVPLRYGAVFTVEAGRGELTADARGGSGVFGLRVGYVLPLGPAEDEESPE